MFFVVLNCRTEKYYNQDTSKWVSSICCASFFDFQTQADEVVNLMKSQGILITLHESEDLSAARIDLAVDMMATI